MNRISFALSDSAINPLSDKFSNGSLITLSDKWSIFDLGDGYIEVISVVQLRSVIAFLATLVEFPEPISMYLSGSYFAIIPYILMMSRPGRNPLFHAGLFLSF